jgi:alkylation response protein AidB-like acyl-CoA dehydrogenase
MSSTATTTPTGAATAGGDLLQAARELGPEIESRAAEIEAAGTLPRDLVERLRTVGLFSMALPPALGGRGASAETIVSVVEEVSRADGSAGWTVLIGQGSGFLGWLDPAVAAKIVAATPHPLVAGSMAPTGTAVPTGESRAGAGAADGYLLSGRWSFNSGCRHADWVMVAFLQRDGERPLLGPSGQPVVRFALLPAEQVRILDTWQVMGLRGTGSDDLTIDGAVVAHDWTFDPFFEPARQDGPLYRMSFYSFLMTMMAGFPLGVARRALEEFGEIVRREPRPGTRHLLAEDPLVQAGLLRASSQLRAARLLVFDAVRRVWADATAGRAQPPVRAELAAAVQHAQQVAEEVVEWAFHTCGDSAVYADHPLQRCWRDVSAAGQHIAFGAEAQRRMARIQLGLEEPLAHLV